MMVLSTADSLNGNVLRGTNGNNTAALCAPRSSVPPSLDVNSANCQQLLVRSNRQSSANNNDSPIEEESDAHLCDSDSPPPCISPGPSCLWLRAAVLEIYPMDDFDRVEYLGEGFFSDVYKVLQKSTRQLMVLKIGKDRPSVSRSSFDSPKTIDLFSSRHRQKSTVIREVELMKKLLHPNVLGYRGVCVDSTQTCWNLHMLVDFCDGGSLSRLILDLEDPFRWRQRCSLALDVAKGMEYVHGQGYVHRDLTSMNVLLKRTGAQSVRAVVADFGLACAIPQRNDPSLIQAGTPYWMAPECLREEWYDEKADVFSFGVIMCQMIARIDADPDAGLYRTPAFGIDYIRFSVHCPPDTPTDLLRLAFTCCLMNPQSRPAFSKVVEQTALALRSIEPNGRRRSTRTSLLGHRVVHQLETRIGRSLSDAALRPTNIRPVCRRPTRANQSLANTPMEDSDIEVVAENEDEPGPSWQQLAQSVADEDPGYEPSDANPFAEHAKYRSGRKIPPPTTPGRHRHAYHASGGSRVPSVDNPLWTSFDLSSPDGVSSATDEPLSASYRKRLKNPKYSSTPLKDIAMGLPRRCSSLPSSPVSRRKCSGGGGGAALVTSVHGTDLAELLSGPRHEAQGRLTFTFRDVDMKFASLRYPVRRHTEVLMVSPSSSTATETDSYAAATTSSPQSMTSDEVIDNQMAHMAVVEEKDEPSPHSEQKRNVGPIQLNFDDQSDHEDCYEDNPDIIEFESLPKKRLDDDSIDKKLTTVVKFDDAGTVLCAGQNSKRCCIL
uniref:dual-specificity kinase n=1 Tax=Plectus sambesii TaxID=2011161 RepID=A0A914VFW3_9BILA